MWSAGARIVREPRLAGKVSESFRIAAEDVDKIVREAPPASLRVQLPTQFDLTSKVKPAKAIAITVSPALLAPADEINE